jgi:hypothetical protein
MMKRFFQQIVLVALSSSIVLAQTPAKPTQVEVFKSATCGCCGKWIEHMRAAGFTVRVTDLGDAELQQMKKKSGVPDAAKSCHTARVDGYVVEGHVPAPEVRRLLVERRKVVGIAVPGMPIGSPGMEAPGVKAQPYDVLSFDAQGNTKVFSTIKP